MKKPLYMMYYIVLLIICLIGGLYGVASAQPALHRLTVEKSGAGSGTVTSSPAGIKCGGQCFYDFGEGKNVNLTAKADVGSKFISWSGACNGTKGCSIAVSTDITATALFTSESNISISPVSKDFGNVTPGKTKSGQFKVANRGSQPLTIIGTIAVNGPDAAEFALKTDSCSNKTIKPSASCSVTVLFAPGINTAGLKTATMTIPSDDPDTPTLDVALTGRSSAKISVSPAFKNFGVVVPGKSKSTVFKVFNKGTVEMDVANIIFDGLNTDEFTTTADTCSMQHVAPSKYCTVTIAFTPSSTGLKTAQINIPSDDPDTKNLPVALTGGATGQVPTRAWERLSAFGSNFSVSSEIVVDGAGNPAIAYVDNADPYRLYAKSYSGGSWNILQGPISAADASYPSIAVGDNGTLHVGYQDGGVGHKATVKSYNGGGWSLVGTAGFSNDFARGTSLFLKAGTPYLAFLDYDSGGAQEDRITVKWDNGAGWSDFGNARFSDPVINGVFAFSVLPDGKPCAAAYEADATSRYLYVYRHDDPSGTGSPWHKIGDSGSNVPIVTDSSLMSPHLAGDNSGGLYVSYTTWVATDPPRNVVKRYNAVTNTWDGLSGPEGYVDDGKSFFNGFLSDGKDLYVAYIDESVADSYRITVKKFDRPSKKWVLYAGKLPYVLTATQAIQGVSLFVKDGAAYVAVTVYDAAASAYTSAVVKGR